MPAMGERSESADYRVPLEGTARSFVVGFTRGGPIVLRFYRDGTVRFEHTCDRRHALDPKRRSVKPHVVTIAPLLAYGPAGPDHAGKMHSIELGPGSADVTVGGSLLCPDCGLHGMVERSVWRDV